MSAKDELEQIAQQVAQCQLCELHFSRKRAVPGEGPANAEIMFIGEGPGFHENEQGRPFVGAAGKFLDDLLEKIGMRRDQVYITNVVKCRPPSNRDPKPEEVEICTRHYLERQIQAINPKVIITLGRYSMGLFLSNAKISDVHGQSFWVKGRLIVPMYHPAAGLHQISLKPTIEKDFLRLPELLEKSRQVGPESTSPPTFDSDQPARQLSLF
ncbi:MAG: Uracil-DNA glycosylase, family 4 [Anaerolineae bacterium]|nr:MAG: Uracil-DNA glycosylase, family 4 [Anaerolineae bacterium]